mmetsp:Transcript_22562/g.52580  ORF Transcript_22562/g.52580 Transcript_22562/m.52580 type:complete len:202 (-) Transcript_22562:324-929(-)
MPTKHTLSPKTLRLVTGALKITELAMMIMTTLNRAAILLLSADVDRTMRTSERCRLSAMKAPNSTSPVVCASISRSCINSDSSRSCSSSVTAAGIIESAHTGDITNNKAMESICLSGLCTSRCIKTRRKPTIMAANMHRVKPMALKCISPYVARPRPKLMVTITNTKLHRMVSTPAHTDTSKTQIGEELLIISMKCTSKNM